MSKRKTANNTNDSQDIAPKQKKEKKQKKDKKKKINTVNVMRGLIIDTVAKAKSGHPGGALSSADFAYVLFSKYLNYDPQNPAWINRDRFVLSAGHESALLYTLLVLQGFLPAQELQNFRQWGSETPGHPEVDEVHGIDCTTGPLGQGLAMSVGMAAAEVHLQARLGQDIIGHYTYVLCGDGDIQEPIALGAAQLAAHYRLGKLIVFYDRNQVQISGKTSRSDSTDIAKMFKSFGWQVLSIDGHDHKAIQTAIEKAQQSAQEKNCPTLIIGNTVMAKGSASMEGQAAAHGAPFSADEIKATKEKLNLPAEQQFWLPQKAYDDLREKNNKRQKAVAKWQKNLDQRLQKEEDFHKLWNSLLQKNYDFDFPLFEEDSAMATRSSFGKILEALAEQIPALAGGSADLEPSNNTTAFFKKVGDFTANKRQGRNFAFGVREFPMAAFLNGMALHGGLRPFGATFLVFSDYEKAAIRLSALMRLPLLHVFTHDSFYVGEDGPTHQPIEQLAALRSLPNLLVLRPAEANETLAAMRVALRQEKRPCALILTRQNLPTLAVADNNAHPAERGAYVVQDCEGKPDVVLIGSGSELPLALACAQKLGDEDGKKTRVVSMMSFELFDEQPTAYRQEVLPFDVVCKVSLEAASTFGWHKYIGANGLAIGIDHFGASAPASVLEKEFGFVPEAVVEKIRKHFAFG